MANGQDLSHYFKVEAGYLSGVGTINYDNRVTFVNNSSANRLRVSYGVFIDGKTSLGLGFGLDGYRTPGHNTAPLFVEARRFVSKNTNSFFAFTNLGAALELGQAFEKGFHGSMGVGYRKKGRRVDIIPSIGFNVQRIQEGRAIVFDLSTGQAEYIISRITLKSISFNLGFEF